MPFQKDNLVLQVERCKPLCGAQHSGEPRSVSNPAKAFNFSLPHFSFTWGFHIHFSTLKMMHVWDLTFWRGGLCSTLTPSAICSKMWKVKTLCYKCFLIFLAERHILPSAKKCRPSLYFKALNQENFPKILKYGFIVPIVNLFSPCYLQKQNSEIASTVSYCK